MRVSQQNMRLVKGKGPDAGAEIAVPGGFWSEINKPFRPEESTMDAW
jgi:hypothetical protein